MPYARKKDSTHSEVVEALRIYGWSVLDISRAPLAVDLVISRHGRVVLVENKNRKGRLTPGQKKILDEWQGETAVLRSFEDVARLTSDPVVTRMKRL